MLKEIEKFDIQAESYENFIMDRDERMLLKADLFSLYRIETRNLSKK